MFKRLTLIVLLMIASTMVVWAQQYSTSDKKAIKLYERGQEALYQSRTVDAVKCFEQAVAADPHFVEANLMLAEWYLDAGQTSLAKDYYYAAVKSNESFFPQAWLQLGNLELQDNNFAKAISNYDRYLSLKPKDNTHRLEAEYGISCASFRQQALAHPVDFHPENMGAAVNSQYDEYLPALTADGKTLIFTRRMPRKATSTCNTPEEEDFYKSVFENGKWQKAQRMNEPLNSTDNEGAQCVSQDGRIMIFTACERRDGAGRCDLYQCLWHGDKWSKPRNMGAPLNTGSWESQPSLSLDGKTLYFASDRKGGYGGIDIWKSELREGRWSNPVNLGPTINTAGDETCPFIHFDNKTLYFASTGHVGMGGSDLFCARLQEDGSWGTPQNLGYPINTSGNESNLIVAPDGKTALFSSDILEGYGKQDLYSFVLPQEVQPSPVVYEEVFAQTPELEIGESVTLQNVFFETGKYQLIESSLVELDKVVEMLEKYPSMKIELGGHTDNVGSATDNQKLSEQRAKAVYEYLIARGISASRLSYVGYGESQPVASNDSEEGRAQNRRTVFIITQK